MFSQQLQGVFSLLLCCLCLGQLSCSRMIASAMRPVMTNIQQQTNIDLVCEGSPAYLLMIDSMLVSNPENTDLLLAATQSYSGYASALLECGGVNDRRITPIAEKSKSYGIQLLSQHLPLGKSGTSQDSRAFDRQLANLDRGDVPEIFWGCLGWLTWIKNEQGSPEAVADIVVIEKIMARLLQLDESYQGGAIHLFFGNYYASIPAMFGGKPDLSKAHFEKALQLSNRRFLLTQTTYAETLARATFDKQLHDRLLEEVLDFPLDSAPEFALSNQLAVSRARKLLDENYFAE